jgi:hypothetical protein
VFEILGWSLLSDLNTAGGSLVPLDMVGAERILLQSFWLAGAASVSCMYCFTVIWKPSWFDVAPSILGVSA